jgi:hypothetical protein
MASPSPADAPVTKITCESVAVPAALMTSSLTGSRTARQAARHKSMSVAASKQGLEFLFCEETESRQTPQYHHGSREFGISRCTSGFSLAIHTAA